MADKKVKTQIKLQIQAGTMAPTPAIGQALGQHGVNIGEFLKAFAEKTREMGDVLVPVVLTVYEDRTFDFITKLPPVAFLIKKEIGLEKGSGVPNKDKVGKLSKAQLEKIAEAKLPDLNAQNLEAAKKIVAGTARSMGVEVEK